MDTMHNIESQRVREALANLKAITGRDDLIEIVYDHIVQLHDRNGRLALQILALEGELQEAREGWGTRLWRWLNGPKGGQ